MTFLSILWQANQVQIAWGEEGIMNAFVSTCCTQCSLQLQLALLAKIQATHSNLGCWHEGWDDMVIAVHTDDFFRNIRIVFHIFTICRNL